jgi:hypothetical protein
MASSSTGGSFIYTALRETPQELLKNIRREALGGSLDADETRDLLDRLVVAGWVRLEKTETGGRPRERWSVNPRYAGTPRTAERV